jgi:integrase
MPSDKKPNSEKQTANTLTIAKVSVQLFDTKPKPIQGFGEILSYCTWMANHGYSTRHGDRKYRDSTIQSRKATLMSLGCNANILDPDDVKKYLETAQLTPSRKNKIVDDITGFYKYLRTPFLGTYYPVERRLPHVPLESDIDQLISKLGKKQAAFTQVVKETGARPGEVWRLEWADLELDHHTLTINHPEKDSNPRKFPRVSDKLAGLILGVREPGRFVFHADDAAQNSFKHFSRLFFLERKRVAEVTRNDRLLRINWKSLRHFKGTSEYIRTKDLVHVMKVLGHRCIKNTMIYIDLVGLDDDENYVCKIGSTKEERINLIEGGFERVDRDGDEWYFRKRK